MINRDDLTLGVAVLGAVTGCIGTAIGIWNLWLARKSHRYRVKVVTRTFSENFVVEKDGQEFFNPEKRRLDVLVINESYFPITLAEVGLVLKPHLLSRKKFYQLAIGQKNRVESRDSHTCSFSLTPKLHKEPNRLSYLLTNTKWPRIDQCRRVYVVLVTGQRYEGNNTEFRASVSKLREILTPRVDSDTRA